MTLQWDHCLQVMVKVGSKQHPRKQTGLFVTGDVREMIEVKGLNSSMIIISRNNQAIQVIKKDIKFRHEKDFIGYFMGIICPLGSSAAHKRYRS